ncbi:glycosyltransferase [Pantoea ananatis]|uniref:glycosyltransferase n=1 Tax=Pantoea ananas TaxID=553 RepID=UPI002350FADE|nr:glycosyltransferase [Pantoea ananatis]MDC7859343.1 hypothetical protein [Pantoea ananatis]
MKLTALIVTFNRLEKLKITLEATLKLPFQNIIIVDNASTDNTSLWLAELKEPRIHIITSSDNSGGAGGFHLGAQFISQHVHTDWVVFYDDDAYPEESFIDKFSLLKPDNKNAYCAKVLDLNGAVCRMNIPWVKITKTFRDNIYYFFNKKSFIADVQKNCQCLTFSFVGCVISAGILKDTYDSINKELFIYYDDVFYSHLLVTQGVKIIYCPELIFRHDVKATSNGTPEPWKVYYLVRNIFLGRKKQKNKCFFSRRAIFSRIMLYFICGFKSYNIAAYYKFFFKGLIDGVRNLSGKRH